MYPYVIRARGGKDNVQCIDCIDVILVDGMECQDRVLTCHVLV